MSKAPKTATISDRLREIAVQKTALEQEETKLRQDLAATTRTFLQEIVEFLDPSVA